MFKTALEAMQATIYSKLGSELDALWQLVIDYRDKELSTVTDYRLRFKKVREFFHNNCAKRFMDIVWNHTGLWITDVRYVECWESGFCTWIFINNDDKVLSYDGTFQIEKILDGGYLERYWYTTIPDNLTAEQLFKIATSYDKIKGSIKQSQREEIKKLVKSRIGFDIRTGFLLEDFFPANSGVSNFTAQEITAIVLHEIGHTLTLVEHAADLYARTSSFNYLSAAFQAARGGDAKEAVALTKMVAAAAEKKGNKDAADKVRKLAIKFEADMAQAGSNGDPRTKRKLIGGLIWATFTLMGDVIFMAFDFLAGNSARFKYNRGDQKKKFGDIPCNGRMVTWQERKADEYAFTHGYGKHQVTSLDKLGKMFARLGKTEDEIAKITSAEKLGKDISFLEKMRLLLYAPQVCGDYSYSLYPAGSQRFKEMLNLTVQQLKVCGADPEMVRKYMEDIESIKDKIDHCEKHDEYLAKVVKGYELLNEYLSIPSFFDCIIHGRVRKEIDDLVNDIQNLSGNLIHFYGMKLQALAKKGN